MPSRGYGRPVSAWPSEREEEEERFNPKCYPSGCPPSSLLLGALTGSSVLKLQQSQPSAKIITAIVNTSNFNYVVLPSLVVFGPQTIWPDAEYFSRLIFILFNSLVIFLSAIPSPWSTLVEVIPQLHQVPGLHSFMPGFLAASRLLVPKVTVLNS